jgi:cbb3-type cytochrome oxidase subunit 1
MGVWLLGQLGSATFAFFAILDHAAPRVLRRDWGGSIAVDTQLWSTLAGVVLCCFALIGAGIAHGSLRAGGAPAEEVQATLSWFLMVAGAGLGLVALGGLAALVALFVMYTTARRAEYVPNPEASAGELPAGAQTAH